MPARSKISMLPEEVRKEFEKRLIGSCFSGYSALSDWLKAKGYEISRSAAQNFGQKFQSQLGAMKIATEQARTIAEAVGDDPGALGDMLTRLCQEKAFEILIDMEDPDPSKVDFIKMGTMISMLNRVSIAQKKWMNEVKEKARLAANSVAKVARQEGLSKERAEEIRKIILGIV